MICPKCGNEIVVGTKCECAYERENIARNARFESLGSGLVIATAIIYPIIFVIFSVIMFYLQVSSLIGLILSLICVAGFIVSIVLGGFYFVIIPLPFIYFFKYGCQKPLLSNKQKIIYGILAFACAIGVLVFNLLI